MNVIEAIKARHSVRQFKDMPVWFKNGMLAAVLAPTAVDWQRSFIGIDGENAVITAGRSPMSKILCILSDRLAPV